MTSRLSWARIGVAALALVAFALVILATRQGVGASHDSTIYVAGAESLADGGGFDRWDDRPVSSFPPGFSLTLAAGDLAGVSPRVGARLLNAGAAAALAVMTFLVSRRHLRDPRLAVGAAAAVAVGPATVDVFSYAWTEPVFCVLVMALLWTIEPLYGPDRDRTALLAAAGGISALLFAYRYVGAAPAAVAFGLIVLRAWPDGRRAVVRRAGIFLATAAVIPALIVARNLALGVDPFGERTASSETVSGLIDKVLTVGSTWVLPDAFPRTLRLAALLGVVILTAVGLVVARRRRLDDTMGAAGDRWEPPSLVPLGAVTIAYLVALAASVLGNTLDPVSLRLLAPVFAPCVVLAIVALEALAWDRVGSATRLGVLALGGAWLAGCLVFSFNHTRLWGREGRGVNTVAWQRSPLVAEIERGHTPGLLFSNAPDALWYASGVRPVHESPTAVSADGLTFVREAVEERGQVWLAWFDAVPSDDLVTPDDFVASGLALEPVATTPDGVLYRIG